VILQFRRATVQNHVTGELEPATYRISKSAWLKAQEHQHILQVICLFFLINFLIRQQLIFEIMNFQVTRRVGDITGLDMDTAEDLQVVNYGIGGHYDPHFDYARVSNFKYITRK